MMTTEAAYLSFDEESRGSIEPGKLGDLVILSDHILTCTPEQLRAIKAEATILGGKVVYEREKK
jgi:predicted amidohydrolase YtcJ